MKEGYGFEEIAGAGITAVKGINATGVFCGIKREKRDLALVTSDSPAAAAGMFTSNLVQAAPVRLCRERVGSPVKALLINSGNANACTGEKGWQNALEMATHTAGYLRLNPEEVLVCSTGVIGEQMPMEKIRAGIASAAGALSSEPLSGTAAAEAIMTTDTVIKQAAYGGKLPAGAFTLAGMAKGAGMICPKMATMLAFFFTDAIVQRPLLDRLFRDAVEKTFNLITVDGDTSTNDTALLLANGLSGVEIIEGSPGEDLFAAMLYHACRDLAYRIIRDAEGATKVITLTIEGAPDAQAARILARSVLNSPLVKTAFYGEDANWGRILAALGYAGVDFDPGRVDIAIGPIPVAAAGEAVPFHEADMKKILKQAEIPVKVDLRAGDVTVTAWGSDLSHEYVSINSSYRS